MGALAAQSVERTGWPTQMGDRGAALLDRLPLPPGADAAVEALLSERRLGQLAEAGLLPVAGEKRSARAFLPANNSVGGRAMAYAWFMNRLSEFLYLLRLEEEKRGVGEDRAARKERLAGHCLEFFNQSGPLAPQRFGLELEPGVLRLELVPSQQVLPGAPIMRLEFDW